LTLVHITDAFLSDQLVELKLPEGPDPTRWCTFSFHLLSVSLCIATSSRINLSLSEVGLLSLHIH